MPSVQRISIGVSGVHEIHTKDGGSEGCSISIPSCSKFCGMHVSRIRCCWYGCNSCIDWNIVAMMEWQMNKDVEAARTVFDWGMNKHDTEPAFVLEYIKFLTHLNDENSKQLSCEIKYCKICEFYLKEQWARSQKKVPEKYGIFIWHLKEIMGIYQQCPRLKEGKKNCILNLVFPYLFLLICILDKEGILSLVKRYRYLDLWPCTEAELQSFSNVENWVCLFFSYRSSSSRTSIRTKGRQCQ